MQALKCRCCDLGLEGHLACLVFRCWKAFELGFRAALVVSEPCVGFGSGLHFLS